MLDDENLFSYPYFHVTHQDPTAKIFKIVCTSSKFNTFHATIIFSKTIVWDLFLGAICSSRPDAPFASICSTMSKKEFVEISQNHLVIFSENREHLTSNACNFLENIF
jgi:hypothetical protein